MTADDPNDHDSGAGPNGRPDRDDPHAHHRDGTNDMDHADEPTDRLAHLLSVASDAADDAHGAPVADADDLGRRIRARAARRTRVAGVAAAVLLATAGVGGFAVGRGTSETDGGGGEVLATASSPAADVAGDAAERSMAGDAAAPETTLADLSMPSEHTSIGLGSDLPADPLFARTLADGTVLDVRIYRYPASSLPADGPCQAVGDLYVGVRAPDAVGQVYGQFHSSIAPGVLMVSVTTIGVPEGAPRWVIVAQGAADVATIRATFPDGSTDQAAVHEHMVALATRSGAPFVRAPLRSDEVLVEGLDASGAVVARWAGDRWGGRASSTVVGEVAAQEVPPAPEKAPETTHPAPTEVQVAPDDPATTPLPIEPDGDVIDVGPGHPGGGSTSACPAP